MLDRYSHVLDVVARVICVITAVLMAWLIAITGYQVFGRYVLNDSPSWVERSALLTIVYISLPMAAVGIRQRFHMTVTIMTDRFGPRGQTVIDMICDVVLALFGIAMAWYGGVIANRVWASKMSVLPLPEGMTYVPLVLSGILIVLFSLEHLAISAGRLRMPKIPTA